MPFILLHNKRNYIAVRTATNALSCSRSRCGRRLTLGSPFTPRFFSASSASSSTPRASLISLRSKYFNSSHAAIALISLSVGYFYGSCSQQEKALFPSQNHVLPDGLPRTCCDAPSPTTNNAASNNEPNNLPIAPLTKEQMLLPGHLMKIAGKENVLFGLEYTPDTTPFLAGMRLGRGHALCIVTPRHVQDVVDCVQAIVDADCVVIPQGQNTGLTGGSVPRNSSKNDEKDQRPAVILSMKHLNSIIPIDDGQRMICLAGVGLAQLQSFLNKEFPGREAHSQLGSTFLNPTTAAGVALGSGGTQLRKGPAYTERAMYIKVTTNKWRESIVECVNTIGLPNLEEWDRLPEHNKRKMDKAPYKLNTISRWIDFEGSGYASPDCQHHYYSSRTDPHGSAPASAAAYYPQHICQLDDNVSRYNADTRGPEFNRSEGKVVILATVHDTFPKPKAVQTYWLSFDSLDTALAFRREVCLANPTDLPISLEYMDRDAYDVVDQAGRLMGWSIIVLGMTSPLLRQAWNAKSWIESKLDNPIVVDKWLYRLNGIAPSVMPNSIAKLGRHYDHHVAMTVGEFGSGNMQRLVERMEAFVEKYNQGVENDKGVKKDRVVVCEATPRMSNAINAFRFVAAPAFRTWCVGNGAQGFSVDYALPKNGGAAPTLKGSEKLSMGECAPLPIKRMRYSHFGCNVVHEDFAYAAGVNVEQRKYDFKKQVEFKCGGRLPAEHGHGTEYHAPEDTQERWKNMDPLNVLNPGVGGLSDKFLYKD